MGRHQTTWTDVAAWHERGRRLLLFLRVLGREIVEDKLIIRAPGLAYTSLLAIVPLVTVVFALFTAFSAFNELKEQIQGFLLHRLLPSGQEQIMTYIDKFAQNATNLGVVGFLFLVVTSVLLLDTIAWNFNELWHVKTRRRLMNRVMAYTSVLVFGALLMGVSVLVSSRIERVLFSGTSLERFGFVAHIGSLLFPLVSSFLAFLIMYVVIPATTVRVTSAAVGAGFTAVTWEIAKALFANSIGQSVRYSTVYGSLAAVPIFLIWLYVTWGLVLLGLDIAYLHQNFAAVVARRSFVELSTRQRLAVAVRVFEAVAAAFQRGDPPPEGEALAESLELPDYAVRDAVTVLDRSGIVRRAAGEDGAESGLLPARPLDRIRVRDVVRAAFRAPEEPTASDEPPASEAEAAVRRFEAAGCGELGDLGFEELSGGGERTGS